ncbi:MAG TPA: putative DNA binding domain-containing protein [Candidatus Marinimicrobia bacterium]|nr:putative DNA binding domain-containing protein [Candidatus Neomarinimicrobiota bacterium]HRS90699.1 putative DNA binding domain-containing protein [Candidatus Neomarinimicrobiota bacterium]
MNEQQDIEFKSQWSDTVLKTGVTFANTNGGSIYRCMDDNVNPVELKMEEQNQADEKLRTILKEMGVW